MKLTKNCFGPWEYFQVHAGGKIQCCGGACDTDVGDFIIDCLENNKRGIDYDVFNNERIQDVREGLLTGNLRKMCRECFFNTDELVTTEQYRKNLIEYLQRRRPEWTDLESTDLTKLCAFDRMAISLTNRCNFRCVYCVQSTLGDTNPYFKMEFPEEFIEEALDILAGQNIRELCTTVEGECTMNKNFTKIFSRFHKEHPEINLVVTTNFSRKYDDEDFELFAQFDNLDISIDTLDPKLFKDITKNGDLSVILNNIDKVEAKIKELGVKRPRMSVHVVVSNLTWRGLPELADYAFSHQMDLFLGNCEIRQNSLGYQTGQLMQISDMESEDQRQARDIILNIRERAQELGRICTAQGSLLYKVNKNVEHNYNRFNLYDDNPIFKAFYQKYPNGMEKKHLDIVYDYDNLAYIGILLQRGEVLELTDIQDYNTIILREVAVYKVGTASSKYNQSVLPKYRKKIKIEETFTYVPDFSDENVAAVLLEISDYWNEE